MRNYKISYADNGNGKFGTWVGQYSRIELTDNPNDSELKDVKVFKLNHDEGMETLDLVLIGHRITFINYDADDDDDDDDDDDIPSKSWYSELSIGYFYFIIGLAVGYLLFHK